MTRSAARRTEQKRETDEEAAVAAWIERHVRESPPLSDDQLHRMGEILGVRLTRRSATRA